VGVYAGPSVNAGWALIYRWSPNGNDVPITYQVNNSELLVKFYML
jgi:hypothetical protein